MNVAKQQPDRRNSDEIMTIPFEFVREGLCCWMLVKVATTTTCWQTFSYLALRYHVRPPLLNLNRMNSKQTSLVPAKLRGSFRHIRDPTPRDNASNNQGIRRSRLPQYPDAALLHIP